MSAITKARDVLIAIIGNSVDQAVGAVSDNEKDIKAVMHSLDLTEKQARIAISALKETAERDLWKFEGE